MHSIYEKLSIAFNLGLRCEKCILTKEQEDLVYYFTDGHGEEHFVRQAEGRCSLASMIAFDTEKEEQQLDKQIIELQSILTMHEIDYQDVMQ